MWVKPIFKTQSAKPVKNICPADLKKTFIFTLAAHSHLQRWCQPHFPFGGALKSAPCSSHELQPGKWWTSSLLRSDSFASFVLTYIAFFLSNHLFSQATGGCHGDHGPTQRVIKGLESLWLQSSDVRLKNSRMLARTEIRWLIWSYRIPRCQRSSNIRPFVKNIEPASYLVFIPHSSWFSCCVLLVFDGKQGGETPQGCRTWWCIVCMGVTMG